MTNGEKMQAAFPDIEMWGESKDTLDYSLGGMIHRITKSWWNAEYKDPTTLGVDAISRTDAIRVASGYCHPSNVAKELTKLPPVIPQPRKGYWISHREHCEMNNLLPSGLGSYCWCSECDCGIDSKHFHRVYYNYCPNCGADMRCDSSKDE